MREIPIPVEAEKREKISRALKRKSTTYSVLFYIFLAVAVIGFLGAVIAVIVLEFRQDTSPMLAVILITSLLCGGAVGGGLSYLFSRLLTGADRARLDFEERCDSEKSFYVGEGTLLTFEEGGVLLHGDENSKNIRIPYAEIRIFSVCTRRAPREKGEWSVVFELPSHYLAKNGKAEGSETILVQTDAKERLYRVIEEAGLSLLGEDHSPKENRRYTLKTKFYVPVTDKRRRAIVTMVLGFVVAAAGIPVAIVWNVTIGSFLSVIGLFLGLRSLSTFLGAKSVFSVYEEGIFWKDANGDRIFLKWEEIGGIVRGKAGGSDVIKLQCSYGAYHLPDIVGVYEYLRENYPEKCGEKA